MKKLYGKIFIKATLKLITGLHIGTSGDFSAIGAVDNIVIRDSITNRPIIPGSSLKGKMRFLLARTKYSETSLTMSEIKDEVYEIKRLFGGSEGEKIILSRLQFHDSVISDTSAKYLEKLDLDLPYTEIKYENTIDRAIGLAKPRQQERVPAGVEFDLTITYNIEDFDEIEDDLHNISNMIELLEDDYLGGHGTRGYGRVAIKDIETGVKLYSQEDKIDYIKNLVKILKDKGE